MATPWRIRKNKTFVEGFIVCSQGFYGLKVGYIARYQPVLYATEYSGSGIFMF